ncbi:MAG: WD40/YVTN/BNR-like repeat-containing protein [Thermoanaerobaculia bacterium]
MTRPKMALSALVPLVGLLALVLAAAGPLPTLRPMPDTVKEKLRRTAHRATGSRFDQPDLAWRHYREKRLGGVQVDAARLYERARQRLAEMPVYSTRGGRFVGEVDDESPQRRLAAAALGTWEPLGPGNVGGRTRAFVIRPDRPAVMWAGGVSGGVWKSGDRGRSWRPVGDQLANLAVNVLRLDPNDPRVLYAGTGEGYFREAVRGTALPLRGGGIFKSEDGGTTWARLPGTDRGRFYFVNDLVISRHDPERIYAATRQGIFRTKNGGESWQQVLNPRVRGGCLDLVERTDKRHNDYLLAGCGTLAPGAVWRNIAAETDRVWERALAEPGMARTSLAVAPSQQRTIYALAASNVPGPNGRYEQALHAVYRSDRGGAAGSWRATVRNTDPVKVNTLLLSNPITASLADCQFDNVNNFFAMGWYVNVIGVDPSDPERLWAGGVDIFRSDDGGANWRPASYWWAEPNNPNFAHADQHGLVFDPRNSSVLYLLNDGGIYRTTNARAALSPNADAICNPGVNQLSWESLNNNYGATQFYHGSVFPNGREYLGGTQDNGTVRSELGRNNSWFRILGGDGGYSAIDSTNPLTVYASVQGGRVFKSIGGDFEQVTAGINDLGGRGDFTARPDNYLFIAPFVMDPNDPARLWIGGRRLYRTDDGANFWAPASARLAQVGKVSALAVAPGDSDGVLAGTTAGDIFRTDIGTRADGDTVWEGTRPRQGWVSWLAFDPRDPDVVYATYARFGGRHVWKSGDGGSTWRSLDGTGPTRVPNLPVHSLAVDPRNSRRIYLGTDLGVLVSVDGGKSWAMENTGFAAAVTESLAVAANPGGTPDLFAFTHGRGAWRVPFVP